MINNFLHLFFILHSIFAIRRLKFSRGQRLDEKHKIIEIFFIWIVYTRDTLEGL